MPVTGDTLLVPAASETPRRAIHVTLLVNPFANRGSAAHRVEDARSALARIGTVSVEPTQFPGDEARIVQLAMDRQSHTLFVLGGDGTVSNASRALVRAESALPLAILAAGTGNDFAKSIRAPVHDYAAMAALAADKAVRAVDAGRVDDEVFVNSAGFGFDVEVLKQTLRPSWLRGNAVYLSAALGQLFRFRGFRARVQLDDIVLDQRWLTLVFANGAWFGGTFQIAPDAALSDGALDAISIRDTSPWRRVRLFADAPRGTHVRHTEVTVSRAARFTVHFEQPPAFQADGELRQAASSTVEIVSLPDALRVVAP